jgi:hypothetical protein
LEAGKLTTLPHLKPENKNPAVRKNGRVFFAFATGRL